MHALIRLEDERKSCGILADFVPSVTLNQGLLTSDMEIHSPAKINLFLHITGKREDGYHTLESLMCAIGLHDTLRLNFKADHISIVCDHPHVPENNSNLAAKAAHLFFKTAGIDSGVKISITKRIPVAAGLGGGSSNAAAVLRGLNHYFGNRFSITELTRMGEKLGADVPFFISGKPAIATGIGECLEPYNNLNPWHLIVIYPGFCVSTAEVYNRLNLRLTNCKKDFKYSRFKTQGVDISRYLSNDLETVTPFMFPEISEVKRALSEQGAAGVLMSGSGPSVFGLFMNAEEARNAYHTLSRHKKWHACLTELII